MAQNTKIGWCDATFNPWWGCVEAGAECDNCYARTYSERLKRAKWGKDEPRTLASEKTWSLLAQWDRAAERAGKPARVFVASMADVMENRRDLDAPRARLWEEVEKRKHLTFLLLTKRPEMYGLLVPAKWHAEGWPSNVWAGTTCGDRKGLARVRALIRNAQGARVRWVSGEPLLEEVDFGRFIGDVGGPGIDWVVVGGESGEGRRDPGVQALVSTALWAHDAGAAVYFKQDVDRFPGKQGRVPDEVWSLKEHPAP